MGRLGSFLVSLLNALLVGAVFVLLGISFFRPDWIVAFLDWIKLTVQALGAWNYLVAFLAASLESFPFIGTFLPGQQIMLIVGGFFGADNLFPTMLVSAVGACLGNAAGFFLGRAYGHELLERFGDAVGLGRTERAYMEKGIQSEGGWFIVLGKFHNFARSFVPFIAGAARMETTRFWVWNIIGSIIWSVCILLLGVVFATYYATITQYIGYGFLVILIAIFGYFWVFRREALTAYWQAKQAEIEAKAQEAATKRITQVSASDNVKP